MSAEPPQASSALSSALFRESALDVVKSVGATT